MCHMDHMWLVPHHRYLLVHEVAPKTSLPSYTEMKFLQIHSISLSIYLECPGSLFYAPCLGFLIYKKQRPDHNTMTLSYSGIRSCFHLMPMD